MENKYPNPKVVIDILKKLLNDKQKTIMIQEELIKEYQKEICDLTDKLRLVIITFSEN